MSLPARSPLAALLAAWVGTIALGCATPPETAPQAVPPSSAPVVEARPLANHIPGAGLRWLVVLSPKRLLADPELVEQWSPVFQADRIKAFTAASGMNLKQIEEIWIAGYDLGTLVLFDAKISGDSAEEAFRNRALTTREVDSPFTNLIHVTGMIEQAPHALVHVEDHLVAIAIGDIRLARIVRAYAEGKLEKSPPALSTSFLSPFSDFDAEAPVRAFLLGPFEEATDVVASSFISGVATVRRTGGKLHIKAQALGLWPNTPDLDDRLTNWTDQLLSTRELRALGWGFPVRPPEVECRTARRDDFINCSATGEWDSARLAQALYRITSGSIEEIVGDAPPGWQPRATTNKPQAEIHEEIETTDRPEAPLEKRDESGVDSNAPHTSN